MVTEQLTEQLMALPLAERVALAEALWESIDGSARGAGQEDDAVALAMRRDAELSSGTAVSRSHEQVMEAARRVLECG